jgi:hypothetical protein
MHKVYEDVENHLRNISQTVSSNLLTLHYFTKACYTCFTEPCYFDYTYEYILKCFTYVLNENVFSKDIIYEK